MDTDDDSKFQQQKARMYAFLCCVGMLDMPGKDLFVIRSSKMLSYIFDMQMSY